MEDAHATYRNGVRALAIPLPPSMVIKIPVEIGGGEPKQIAA